jgi:plasmid replication initiation protein
MEVLEETELEIIKQQQKEYDEIVNAELIIAQRYEAKETRFQQEMSRRAVQDKSRKAEKKSAHQKLNARSIAKGYLFGLREEAIKEVHSLGILVTPKVRHIEEEVLPWLLGKIQDFLHEDNAAT